jgi:hypothetical protein
VLKVLPQRFGRYGLTIHPDKTRLVPFREPQSADSGKGTGSGGQPGTFTLLGITHYWCCSRRGNWVVKRKTASSRLSRALRSIALWCRFNRHRPLQEQQQTLSQKLRGHFAYYGITGNSSALSWFRYGVVCCWRKWLNRRNRERCLDWNLFNRLLERYPLPPARVVHSVCARAQVHDLRNCSIKDARTGLWGPGWVTAGATRPFIFLFGLIKYERKMMSLSGRGTWIVWSPISASHELTTEPRDVMKPNCKTPVRARAASSFRVLFSGPCLGCITGSSILAIVRAAAVWTNLYLSAGSGLMLPMAVWHPDPVP